jgi:uncharacterized membrane protein
MEIGLIILSRWLHLLSAAVAVGGFFFAWLVLPAGLAILQPADREAVLLQTRRRFKPFVHSAILLLIITGIYNTMLNWGKYKLNPPLLHPIWGTHVLLAVAAFCVAFYVLAGRSLRTNHRLLMAINLTLLIAAIAAASTLKWAREKTVAEHSTPTAEMR